MHVSSNFRVVLAAALLTFVICLLGLRAERSLTRHPTAPPASDTELSVDASGSLTASHSH
jgi:hypothetical protein